MHDVLVFSGGDVDGALGDAAGAVVAELEAEALPRGVVADLAEAHRRGLDLGVSDREGEVGLARHRLGVRRPEAAAQRLQEVVDRVDDSPRPLAEDVERASVGRGADRDLLKGPGLRREADADRVPALDRGLGDGKVRAGHAVQVVRELARRVADSPGRVRRDDDGGLGKAVRRKDEGGRLRGRRGGEKKGGRRRQKSRCPEVHGLSPFEVVKIIPQRRRGAHEIRCLFKHEFFVISCLSPAGEGKNAGKIGKRAGLLL